MKGIQWEQENPIRDTGHRVYNRPVSPHYAFLQYIGLVAVNTDRSFHLLQQFGSFWMTGVYPRGLKGRTLRYETVQVRLLLKSDQILSFLQFSPFAFFLVPSNRILEKTSQPSTFPSSSSLPFREAPTPGS